MESLASARKRGATILAEYLGGAVTCDAHHMTDPRADGLGVATCIANALSDGGVSPEEVRSRGGEGLGGWGRCACMVCTLGEREREDVRRTCHVLG